MNLNALRYIVAVADAHSISLAAKAMFVSQPTISQSIQTVEKQLGIRLFDRSTIPLTLTPEGIVYIDWARSILLTYSQVKRKIKYNNTQRENRLSIGIAPHRSSIMLPDIISQLSSEFQNTVFPIKAALVSDLYQSLNSKDIDILVTDEPDNPLPYTSIRVRREKIMLAVPDALCDGLPAAQNGVPFPSVSIQQFVSVPFISYSSNTYLGVSLRKLCELNDFLPLLAAEVSNVDTAHALVSHGLGVTLLPEFTILYGVPQPGVSYFYIDKFSPERQLTIVYRKNEKLTPLAQRFIELFITQFGQEESPAPHN